MECNLGIPFEKVTDEYHLYISGEVKGPYSKKQLKSMWENGLITSDSQYWREGLDEWCYLENLFESNEDNQEKHLQLENATNENLNCRSYKNTTKRPKERSGFLKLTILATLIFLLITLAQHLFINLPCAPTAQKKTDPSSGYIPNKNIKVGILQDVLTKTSSEQKACENLIKQGEDAPTTNEAIEFYNKAIEVNGSSFLAYLRRAYAYYKLEQIGYPMRESEIDKYADSSISDYTHAMELNPKSADAVYGRGLAYSLKALQHVPNHSPDHYQELQIFSDYRHGLSDYAKALEINPNLNEAKEAIGKVNKLLQSAIDEAKPYERKVEANDTSKTTEVNSEKLFNPNDPRSVADSYINSLKKQRIVKESRFLGLRSGAPQWPKGYIAVYSLDYVTEGGFRREGQYILLILPMKENNILFVADAYPAQTSTGF